MFRTGKAGLSLHSAFELLEPKISSGGSREIVCYDFLMILLDELAVSAGATGPPFPLIQCHISSVITNSLLEADD